MWRERGYRQKASHSAKSPQLTHQPEGRSSSEKVAWISVIPAKTEYQSPGATAGGWRRLDIRPTPSATCPRESVLPIRLRPDFSVVLGGYAGGAVNRPRLQGGPEVVSPGRYAPDLLTAPVPVNSPKSLLSNHLLKSVTHASWKDHLDGGRNTDRTLSAEPQDGCSWRPISSRRTFVLCAESSTC